uniref:Uncharacterized protein n=1 Tax=Rhizophora mucronata TaxID=61149 RepID=A0A2P2IMJ1_RHIMU
MFKPFPKTLIYVVRLIMSLFQNCLML